MTVGVKSIMDCIGVDTGGTVSVLGDLFGFIRNRVPIEQDPSVTAEVSLLQLVRDLQGDHIHINVIRVGFDALSATDQADGLDKIDYSIYRIRNIYRPVGIGVGRIEHWFITAAEANGRDDLGSTDEAEQLWEEWSVPGDGIDAFVVRNFVPFAGWSPVEGNCTKGRKDDGLIAGEINRTFEQVSRTFAHEVGHFLGLEHNHDDGECPATPAGLTNLMAQTGCVSNVRTAVVLTAGQGNTMDDHCSIRGGC